MEKINNQIVQSENDQGLRLVLLVTYGCCLNCEYCFIDKTSKSMSLDDMLKSVDLLLTSKKKDLQLHFFGGEPLMIPFDFIKKTVVYTERRMKETGKLINIFLTTNGVPLRRDMIEFFKKHNVVLELSLDGAAEAQNANRPQKVGARDSYSLIAKNIPDIIESKMVARVSMVVSPKTVNNFFENFGHVAALGFKDIFIMVACGVPWDDDSIATFKKHLALVEDKYYGDIESGKITLLNLDDWLAPFRVNTELAVDIDGSIFSACVGYLVHDNDLKKKMILGNIKNYKSDIDTLHSCRLANEEATQVIYHQSNVLQDLPSNIIAGEMMNEFVANLAKRLEKSGDRFRGVRIKNAFEKSLDFLIKANGFENDDVIMKMRKALLQSPAVSFGRGFKFDFSFKNAQSEKLLRFTFNGKNESSFNEVCLQLFRSFKLKKSNLEKIEAVMRMIPSESLTFGIDWRGHDNKDSELKLEFENLDANFLKKVFSIIGLGDKLDTVTMIKQGAMAMSIAFSLGGDIEFKIHFSMKSIVEISESSLVNDFYRKKIVNFFAPLENDQEKRNDYFYLISPRYSVTQGFKSLKCYRVYETGADFISDDSSVSRRYQDIDKLGIMVNKEEQRYIELLGDICSKEKTKLFPSIIGVDFSQTTETGLYFTIK